jgi:hypothetical protein
VSTDPETVRVGELFVPEAVHVPALLSTTGVLLSYSPVGTVTTEIVLPLLLPVNVAVIVPVPDEYFAHAIFAEVVELPIVGPIVQLPSIVIPEVDREVRTWLLLAVQRTTIRSPDEAENDVLVVTSVLLVEETPLASVTTDGLAIIYLSVAGHSQIHSSRQRPSTHKSEQHSPLPLHL